MHTDWLITIYHNTMESENVLSIYFRKVENFFFPSSLKLR